MADSKLEHSFDSAKQRTSKREWFSPPIARTAGEPVDGLLDALLLRLDAESEFLGRLSLKPRRTAYWVILDHRDHRSLIKVGPELGSQRWLIQTERDGHYSPLDIDACLEKLGEVLEEIVRDKSLAVYSTCKDVRHA